MWGVQKQVGRYTKGIYICEHIYSIIVCGFHKLGLIPWFFQNFTLGLEIKLISKFLVFIMMHHTYWWEIYLRCGMCGYQVLLDLDMSWLPLTKDHPHTNAVTMESHSLVSIIYYLHNTDLHDQCISGQWDRRTECHRKAKHCCGTGAAANNMTMYDNGQRATNSDQLVANDRHSLSLHIVKVFDLDQWNNSQGPISGGRATRPNITHYQPWS